MLFVELLRDWQQCPSWIRIVTGPLSTVWRDIINDLVQHFELDPDQLIVATYDWRMPPSKMQERDKYFFSLKKKIEYTVELDGNVGGLVVIAHSMGNGVFRYFLEWLKEEVGRNNWQSGSTNTSRPTSLWARRCSEVRNLLS